MTSSLLVPLLTAVLAVPQAQGGGVVRGVVRSSLDDTPLELAAVEVEGEHRRVAWTDRDGHYELDDIPPGRRTMRVTHTGHERLEIEVRVPEAGEVVLDVTLEVRPVKLAPLLARTNRLLPGVGAPRPAEPIFGASAVRALEGTPGVAEIGLTNVRYDPNDGPPDATDVLYIRGSASDLKLVTLDGAPIYAPFHLGGLMPAFPPAALASSNVLYGGAPVRYDGGLAYILDLETRPGARGFHTEGAADMVAAQGLVEGSLGSRLRLLGAARGVYGAPTEDLLGQAFPYRYTDALGRLDLELGHDKHLALTGFRNGESVALGLLELQNRRVRWANEAISARYTAPMGDDVTAHLGFAMGSFRGILPVGGDEPVTARADVGQVRLTGDFQRRLEDVTLSYGGSFEHTWFEYATRKEGASPDAAPLSRELVLGDAAATYFDATWRLSPRLRLRGGLRGDLYEITRQAKLTPRAGVEYDLSDDATVSFSAGKFHQYVSMPELTAVTTNAVEDLPHLGPPDPVRPLFVGGASHFVAALDQVLTETLKLEMDAYYRRYDPMPLPTAAGTMAAHDSTDQGLESSGVDVWVRRAGNRITGWLGYSLAWTWSPGFGPTAQAVLSGRHLLSAGVAGTLWDGSYLSVRMNYGAGLPLTAVQVADASDVTTTPTTPTGGVSPASVGEPDASYLRLDAELSQTFEGKNGFSLTPYIRVLNALDRRDALFYRQDENGALQPLGDLPLIPVVGFAWAF